MKRNKLLRRTICSVLSAVFVFSTAMVLQYAVQSHTEQEAFEELAAVAAAKVLEEQDASLETPQRDPISPYWSLKEQNADLFGWIAIEGTQINYPVMYTPSDPEYYLRRAFDKSSSQSGVPFLDAGCFENCGNYLIYGHNMNNGTMFASLLSYADEEFWKEHPVIRFDTMDDAGSYSILAAFYSEVYPGEGAGFRYYQYTDLRDAEDFMDYVDQVKAAALYDTGVAAEYGDQLLTLSTCSYHTEGGRFVVVARREE